MKAIRLNKFMENRAGIVIMAVICLSASFLFADVPGKIIKKDGGEVAGMIRYQPASKVYSVTTQGGVAMKIALNDVARVVVRKPATLDSAVAAAQRGQHAAAMPVLEKIMEEYQMLEWDLVAARWLAECYLAKNETRRAEDMCEKVIAANGGKIPAGEFFGVYVKSLIANNKEMKAKKVIQEVIASGDRLTAAIAQIKRGDLDKKKGDMKIALVDGYLRTVILYADVKEVQPEALYNTVKCFEQLQQSSYADKFRKRLLAEFPKDPYTAKLQQGR